MNSSRQFPTTLPFYPPVPYLLGASNLPFTTGSKITPSWKLFFYSPQMEVISLFCAITMVLYTLGSFIWYFALPLLDF